MTALDTHIQEMTAGQGLIALGCQIIDDPSKATHLIARAIARTEKFLCSMSIAKWILDESWAIDSIDRGSLQGKQI